MCFFPCLLTGPALQFARCPSLPQALSPTHVCRHLSLALFLLHSHLPGRSARQFRSAGHANRFTRANGTKTEHLKFLAHVSKCLRRHTHTRVIYTHACARTHTHDQQTQKRVEPTVLDPRMHPHHNQNSCVDMRAPSLPTPFPAPLPSQPLPLPPSPALLLLAFAREHFSCRPCTSGWR